MRRKLFVYVIHRSTLPCSTVDVVISLAVPRDGRTVQVEKRARGKTILPHFAAPGYTVQKLMMVQASKHTHLAAAVCGGSMNEKLFHHLSGICCEKRTRCFPTSLPARGTSDLINPRWIHVAHLHTTDSPCAWVGRGAILCMESRWSRWQDMDVH